MNKLEKHVSDWINETAEDYGSTKDVMHDLMQGGCQSGFVGHLIYYADTVKFYKKYRRQINELLSDTVDQLGMQPADLFGEKWDDSDPLATETNNQNLLAWFGFEETAQRLFE